MPEPMNIRQVAQLARIAVREEDEDRLCAEMADILAFARRLQRLDVEGVPPTQHVIDLHNVLRRDEVQPPLPRQIVLEASPSSAGGYMTVPRTVEEGAAE